MKEIENKKKISINYNNLIINTLIAINEKEKRRIIDSIDIRNYKDVLEKRARERGLEIVYEEDNNNEEVLDQYIYCDRYVNGEIFGIIPSYRTTSLYDSRMNLSFDLCLLFSDITIFQEMSKRDEADIKRLNVMNDSVVLSYIDSLEKERNEIRKYDKDANQECKKINQKIQRIQINRRL